MASESGKNSSIFITELSFKVPPPPQQYRSAESVSIRTQLSILCRLIFLFFNVHEAK